MVKRRKKNNLAKNRNYSDYLVEELKQALKLGQDFSQEFAKKRNAIFLLNLIKKKKKQLKVGSLVFNSVEGLLKNR